MKSEWISVKDSLPPEYCPVLVHVRHTEKWGRSLSNQDAWHVVEEDIWLGDKWSNNADDDIHEVTHWMNMPEPPGSNEL